MATSPDDTLIYKVATAEIVEAARVVGEFPRMPVDLSDGYIHFSTAGQLRETLRRHFAGQTGLVLLAVRLADLGTGVRWEPSRGGELFPHVYGELPFSVISRSATVEVTVEGHTNLPDWAQ